MLLELFLLNARLLRNQLLGSRRDAFRAVLEGLLAVAAVALLYVGARRLSGFDDELAWRISAVVGSALCLAVFFIPAVGARAELFDRQALRGYGIRPLPLAAALLPVTALPVLPLLVALALLPHAVWQGRPFTAGEGFLVTLLLTLQLLLGWRLGRAFGAALRTRRRLRIAVRVIAVALLLGCIASLALMLLPRGLPLIGVIGGQEMARPALDVLSWAGQNQLIRLDESLAASPLGALWVALAPTALGATPAFGRSIAIGLVTVVVLCILWLIVVSVDLRATYRSVPVRDRAAPVAFRGLSSSPLGAMAARSAVYWLRDPRYRSVLLFLPLIPAVIFVACWIGGIPLGLAALLPLPIMLLLLGWATLHNDIAYDSTAMWSLLAVQLDGRSDRLGRAIPVLVIGGLFIVVGAPLTVWMYGDVAVTPVVLGVSIGLLFAAVGVSSAVSVRSPYPAPRPGDGAFQQPVASGSTGFGVQTVSIMLVLLVSSPALVCAALWLLGASGPWNWFALAAGIVAGAGALYAGIRLGGRDFDEAAPELLSYTMQN